MYNHIYILIFERRIREKSSLPVCAKKVTQLCMHGIGVCASITHDNQNDTDTHNFIQIKSKVKKNKRIKPGKGMPNTSQMSYTQHTSRSYTNTIFEECRKKKPEKDGTIHVIYYIIGILVNMICILNRTSWSQPRTHRRRQPRILLSYYKLQLN